MKKIEILALLSFVEGLITMKHKKT